MKFVRSAALYSDRGLIILNKPPGVVCQLHSNRTKNLESSDAYTFDDLLKGLQRTFSLKEMPYPVHRLDKGTTGALAVACSAPMARELSQQFRNRTVEKTYLALVRGGRKTFTSTSGQIRTPIHYIDGRGSLDASRDSRPSVTDWELVGSSPTVPLSLLRLKLHTGHKHQLRIHASQCLNAPILGDTTYSRSLTSEDITRLGITLGDRIFLHASQISFWRYRASGPSKRFRLGICAPLPPDFLALCVKSGIKVDTVEAKGGLSIDDVFLNEKQIQELDGSWVHADCV